MTPRLFFLALASTVNAYLQASQFAEDTCSTLNRWEVARNMTSSAQYLLGSHERSFLLSENCTDHLETAVMNCMDGSKFLCSEFSISVTNNKNTAKGSRSVVLAKKSQSDQTSSAESGCTCSTTNDVSASSSTSADGSSAIIASSVNAVVSNMSTSEGTTSSVPIGTSIVPQSSATSSSSATATSPSMGTSELTTSSVSIVSSTVVESSVITSSSATAVPSSMSTSEASSQFVPSESLVKPQLPTSTRVQPTTTTATVTSSGGTSLTTASICIIKTADLQKGLCYCLDNQIISRTDGDCQTVA